MQIELVDPASAALHSGGAYSEVFKCMNQNLEVAIKVLNIPPDADLRKISRVSYFQVSLSPARASALTTAYAEIL